MTPKKKLIEVALPLEAINKESAREKSIRHGHPSTLHLWWARRPLATCRAVLFASLVDDPSAHPDRFPTEDDQERERQRLFGIIEELVKWDNSNDERVLAAARAEIMASTDGHPPPVLDPFCGGGSIPLEAQRLGLEARASDLNPVAVLITKALIEIPSRFAGHAPVNPGSRGGSLGTGVWKGAQGLAEDVRYYGHWMRDEAEKRIGPLYPRVTLPDAQGKGEATAVAWLWTRTVRCPNPACGAEMPLARSFWLSTKKRGRAWVQPVVNHLAKTVRFSVRTGEGVPSDPPKVGRGAKFRCLVCEQVADDRHIRGEALAGRMGARLMAIVADGHAGRVYIDPNEEHEAAAAFQLPDNVPDQALATDPRNIWCVNYGLTTFADLFTPRQLTALTCFSDLVGEARGRARTDALAAGLPDDGLRVENGGTGATAYADAIATYLAFALSKMADRGSSICTWFTERDSTRNTFARQAIPMTWDFAELNVLLSGTGSFLGGVQWTAESLANAPVHIGTIPQVGQLDASATLGAAASCMVSTDPPYYDNVSYADLSDFFYVWLRRSLRGAYPQLMSTLLVPKSQELVASPYRFDGSKARAQRFFEDGLGAAFNRMREASNDEYPLTVYYAFKQAESDGDRGAPGGAVASTGWETMLEGLLRAGFAVSGTWPMRSELSNRPIASGTNALASSIVLVCRPRPDDAPLTTRREFLAALKAELPDALRRLQHGNVAPVDLAQAAIGPGMAVFSRFAKVVEADGSRMPVGAALAIINQVLDEVLTEQEGEFDADTRWALAWFSQFGHDEGGFGQAETLSKAKNTAVAGMVEAGILASQGGKVRLLRRDELADGWNPRSDVRLTVWEIAEYMIRALEQGGESAAAELLRAVGSLGDVARDLAYRLYTTCERQGWAQEALSYNGLVVAWPVIIRLAGQAAGDSEQTTLEV